MSVTDEFTAMRALRAWGVRYPYDPMATHGTPDDQECFDVSFVEGYEELPPEEYEWQIDGDAVALVYENGELCRHQGPARRPAVVSSTTRDFMERWAAGSSTWDEGRDAGEVQVEGSDAAWRRMLAATGYLRTYSSGTKKPLPQNR